MATETRGVMIGIVMVILFVLGFGLGYAVAPTSPDEENTLTGVVDGIADGVGGGEQSEQSSAAASMDGATTIDASMMTDGQKQMLSALGMDPNNITITPEMVACAEGKIGAARVDEIMNGATPSMGEGVQLVACYSTN